VEGVYQDEIGGVHPHVYYPHPPPGKLRVPDNALLIQDEVEKRPEGLWHHHHIPDVEQDLPPIHHSKTLPLKGLHQLPLVSLIPVHGKAGGQANFTSLGEYLPQPRQGENLQDLLPLPPGAGSEKGTALKEGMLSDEEGPPINHHLQSIGREERTAEPHALGASHHTGEDREPARMRRFRVSITYVLPDDGHGRSP